MRKQFALAGLMALTLGCSAQKTENREVSPFTTIDMKGSLKVIYRHSDSLSLQVQAEGDEMKRVFTSVEGNVLSILNTGNFRGDVKVYVSHNNLQALRAEGAVRFDSEGIIKTSGEFEIRAQGASNMDFELEAEVVKVVASGASKIQLEGQCDRLEAEVSGAADLKAYQMLAKEVKANTSGAAAAKVYAAEKFSGNAEGASSIKIKGSPTDVAAESSAAASISRIDNSRQKTSDTLTYHWKKKKVIIVDDENEQDDKASSRDRKKYEDDHNKGKFKHWRGLSLGINGYLTGTEMKLPPDLKFMELEYSRSFNLQLNIIERHFNIVRHNVKLVTGLGFDWHRYEFANPVTLVEDTSFTWGTLSTEPSIDFRKNRLRTTYLQVPLLLEFNSSNNPRRTFHMAAGVVGQFLIGRSVKQVYEEKDVTSYRVDRSSYNLAPFAVKAHVNFGYRGWTIFAEYGLTTLFKEGAGPALNPFAAGLRVIPFS